ncbi:hypothetical protein LTR56_020970 [Elasticomyces elasticus]|nr:hypothetical protein LTR56_020970 [Elasticomyces elasticus]KAK3646053.1 hypothetical protein LTR22_014488 [Elasticomyces elasticus]KAK4909789.1 hypothetical protein LTR49_021458 [Elasticomyces elasticus]KAK5761765.1 hypothetical protein LTS12_008020 [Elasticomyces elasticus]
MIDDRMQWANTERRSRPSSPATPASPFRSHSPFRYEHERSYGSDHHVTGSSYDQALPLTETRDFLEEAYENYKRLALAAVVEARSRTIERTPSISPPYMRPRTVLGDDSPNHADVYKWDCTMPIVRNDKPYTKPSAFQGTRRKCANCGTSGHIKTNRKLCPLLNGSMPSKNSLSTMPLDGEAAEHPITVASSETVPNTGIQAAQVEAALETSGGPALLAYLEDVSYSWGGVEPDIVQTTEVLEATLPTNDGGLADDEQRVASGHKRDAQSPLRSTEPASSRPFACGICGKTFGRRTLRENHIRTRIDNRTSACSFQGRDETFKQRNEQARHEKAQHAPKQFVCGGLHTSGRPWGCGKAFARRDGLHEHHTKTAKGAQCLQASSGPM